MTSVEFSLAFPTEHIIACVHPVLASQRRVSALPDHPGEHTQHLKAPRPHRMQKGPAHGAQGLLITGDVKTSAKGYSAASSVSVASASVSTSAASSASVSSSA